MRSFITHHLSFIITMNILIFTNRDLASNINLNLLLPHIAPLVKYIFVSDKVGGKNPNPPKELKEIKFFEQTLINDILFPQLETNGARVTSPWFDKINITRTSPLYLTFNELSKKYNIPLQSLNDVKSVENLDFIRSLKPDLILSVRYGKIFGNDFLKIPTQGVINLHSGKLPHYRGVLAVFRTLMNGDTEINATLHYIDDKTIDTGGIIGFSTLKVDKSRSLFWHIMSLYPESTALMVENIAKILRGDEIETQVQNLNNAQYFTFPTHEEVAEFKAKGFSFIELSEYEELIKRYL
jgi:methionyl-tRNA formyltransferase